MGKILENRSENKTGNTRPRRILCGRVKFCAAACFRSRFPIYNRTEILIVEDLRRNVLSNKIKCVFTFMITLYIYIYIPTSQSRLVECRVCKNLQGHTSGFQFFIAFLKFGRFSSDLILFGISSQTFGTRYDKDSVLQYTVLTDLGVKVRLLLIS